jgi:hypothetical protein
MIQSEDKGIYESCSFLSNQERNIQKQNPISCVSCERLFGAAGVELDLAVGSEQTPVLLVHGLAVVTNTGGLPGLIEGLEVEQVDAPGEHAADTSFPELLGVVGTGLGSLVVGTTI